MPISMLTEMPDIVAVGAAILPGGIIQVAGGQFAINSD